ncbi:MAG: DNA repair protein RecO [Legionella sp.]|nr:MAG: DNA repair protein RecO [Legionella sp.]
MTTPVWTIHKTLSGDSSVQALFFTRDQGLVRALYKGGRTPKKQALLREFTPLWVEFSERRGWYYVRHIEIAGASLPLTHTHLFSALYLNELLYHALQPQESYPELYDGYVTSLQHIQTASDMQDLERILRRFEWALLVSLGYGISLTHDAESRLPIEASNYYDLQVSQGFIQSKRGILGAHILALARDDLTDPVVLRTAKYVMRQTIAHALNGKEIRTRALFKISIDKHS